MNLWPAPSVQIPKQKKTPRSHRGGHRGRECRKRSAPKPHRLGGAQRSDNTGAEGTEANGAGRRTEAIGKALSRRRKLDNEVRCAWPRAQSKHAAATGRLLNFLSGGVTRTGRDPAAPAASGRGGSVEPGAKPGEIAPARTAKRRQQNDRKWGRGRGVGEHDKANGQRLSRLERVQLSVTADVESGQQRTRKQTVPGSCTTRAPPNLGIHNRRGYPKPTVGCPSRWAKCCRDVDSMVWHVDSRVA